METNGKPSRCGQGSSEKSYDDKNRSDATGGCKANPTRIAPRPDMYPAGSTMMMMMMYSTPMESVGICKNLVRTSKKLS